MKKKSVLIFIVLLSFNLSAQNICILDIKIKDNLNNPFSYKNIYLFNGSNKINWTFSDEKGNSSFVIDSMPLNTNSVYFLIKTGDSLSSSTKIFINKLKLLERNEIGNYSIRITEFKLFTIAEYHKYLKENHLMPMRKKGVKAIDVN